MGSLDAVHLQALSSFPSEGSAMRAKPLDANHPKIVRELRQLGCSVVSLASLGKGAPDIAVGRRGERGKENWFFEIKDPDKPPSERRLTDAEETFHSLWRGQIDTIETTQDAMRIMKLVVDPRLGFDGVDSR